MHTYEEYLDPLYGNNENSAKTCQPIVVLVDDDDDDVRISIAPLQVRQDLCRGYHDYVVIHFYILYMYYV
jgi:hypothetical protein